MIKGAKRQSILKKKGAFFKNKKKAVAGEISNEIEKNKLTSLVDMKDLNL